MDVNKLIEENMDLVYFCLHKYYPSVAYNEDVIQEGMVGLCKAAKTFDPNRGIAFSTYASKCIITQIIMWFRMNSKHPIFTSLDQEISGHDDSKTTFGATLVGDEDIDFNHLHYIQFIETLDELERDIMKLSITYKQGEVAKILGLSQPTVCRKRKKIEQKWRKFNGEDSD